MSSEALERATVQVRKALDGHFKRGVGGCTTCHKGHDALDALLAEVARLEQERDEKDAELWRWMNKPGGINRKYGWIPKQEADELRAALAVARKREQRLRDAMAYAIAQDRYWVVEVRARKMVEILRAALVDEPAAATGTPAATLAEPEGIHGSAVTAEAAPPGSASAAADEPGEAPQVRRGVGRIVGHRERPPMVVGDDEARGGVSPSGKERGE